MRRLLGIVAIIAFTCIFSQAAISRDGSGNGTTAFTLSGTSTNGFQISAAMRAGSATCATTPAGWTQIACVTNGTNSLKISCRISNTAASGTFTNATNIAGASYSGMSVPGTSANCVNEMVSLNFNGRDGKAVCATVANCGAAASTTVTWRALTNASGGTGTDWYVFGLGTSAGSNCAPTGASSVSATGDIALYDTNATVTSFAGSTCTVTSETWIQWDAELLAANSAGGTPTFIQSVVLSDSQSNAHTSLKAPFGQKTLAGNALICPVKITSGAATAVLTDDVNDAFVSLVGFNDDSNDRIALFGAFNTIGGATAVTATYSTSSTFTKLGCAEFKNVASANPLDVTCASPASSTTGTGMACSAAMTTTNNGELIYQFAQNTNPGYATGGFTQGASPWAFVVSDDWGGEADQYQVQATAGAITPSITQSPSNNYNTVAVALVSGTGGTSAPTTPYIVHLQHNDFFQLDNWTSQANLSLQFPLTGNLLVGMYIGGVGSTAGYDSFYSVVSTTSTTSVSAGSCTINPVSMLGIVVNSKLSIDKGSSNETLTVTGTTGTTFTGTCAKSHSGTYQISGLTDGNSAEYDRAGGAVDNPGTASGINEGFFGPNNAGGGRGALSLKMAMGGYNGAGGGSQLSDILLFDIANASTTAAQDGAQMGATGSDATAGQHNISNVVSITPTSANDICFATMAVQASTVNGVSTNAGSPIFLSGTPIPIGANDATDDNNGWGDITNPALSALQWTWALNGAASNWAAATSCFAAQGLSISNMPPQVF